MKIAHISLLLLLTGAAAPEQNPWKAWGNALARTCPSQHVEFLGDGGFDDFLYALDRSLTPRDRARLDKAADLQRKCAGQQTGFSCEMTSTIEASQRLGLFDDMVAFACRSVKCEEAASCSRVPRS